MSRIARIVWVIASACVALAGAGALAVPVSPAEPGSGGTASPAVEPSSATETATLETILKATAPGPENEILRSMAGNYATTVRTWMDPSRPPATSRGTAELRMVLGGHYLQEDAKGVRMGGPFHGFGYTGYDNIQKRFVSCWLDNMTTGIVVVTGSSEGSGKELHLAGEASDGLTGKVQKYRLVRKLLSADQHVLEMYGTAADGKEVRRMEITYDRVK